MIRDEKETLVVMRNDVRRCLDLLRYVPDKLQDVTRNVEMAVDRLRMLNAMIEALEVEVQKGDDDGENISDG